MASGQEDGGKGTATGRETSGNGKAGGRGNGLFAAVIAVALVIAAVSVVFSFGIIDLGGEEEELPNEPPTADAAATTPTEIAIGGNVTFESYANDTDGEIADYAWHFGDGNSDSGSDLRTVEHTFEYGGHYLVYHVATDDDGEAADNADSLIDVTVSLFDPEEEGLTNESAPFATLEADDQVTLRNDIVTFNMTGCYAVGWNESEGVVEGGLEYIESTVMDFGDGTDTEDIAPEELMSVMHVYALAGHYTASLTVTGLNGESTTVMVTIHVT